MDLGTRSNWAEDVGERFFTVIAVFLPGGQTKKKERATRQCADQNIRRLTENLLNNPQRDMQWQADFCSLQALLRLYGTLVTDELGEAVDAIAGKLLTAIERPVPDRQVIAQQLGALVDCR
ncbi:hypothetical protein [Levilactobacillus fuyuanensis]|uniref:Uncharacterized protein n=1 Tax=Levilactobacillus fuyuanensis TaxID=2486022 RepID=A0ABW4H172_9LACO|nr:hypothetical protein [Levilactobacillus fuyuanensis]